MSAVKPIQSLNTAQLEILKLFSRDLDTSDLVAIKKLIKEYLGNKVVKMADEIWDEKQWDDNKIDDLLNTYQRTPYNPKN